MMKSQVEWKDTSVQWMMKTVVGPIYVVTSDTGLQGILWYEEKMIPLEKRLVGHSPQLRMLAKTVKQVEEYFSGKRTEFDLPFDVVGTPFQKSVWNQLRKIPYGKTCSYRDIAKGVKNEKAVRAVGTANGKNPISIIVPCHRVITSSGSLGGYAGGLVAKTRLLDLEKKKT